MNDKQDIVQHLRDDAAGMRKAATEQPEYYAVLGVYAMTCHDAADEIERLRRENVELRYKIEDLRAYAGSGSVRAAIEADPTLAGACSTLIVGDMIAVRPLSLGDASYLTCEFTVTVHA